MKDEIKIPSYLSNIIDILSLIKIEMVDADKIEVLTNRGDIVASDQLFIMFKKDIKTNSYVSKTIETNNMQEIEISTILDYLVVKGKEKENIIEQHCFAYIYSATLRRHSKEDNMVLYSHIIKLFRTYVYIPHLDDDLEILRINFEIDCFKTNNLFQKYDYIAALRKYLANIYISNRQEIYEYYEEIYEHDENIYKDHINNEDIYDRYGHKNIIMSKSLFYKIINIFNNNTFISNAIFNGNFKTPEILNIIKSLEEHTNFDWYLYIIFNHFIALLLFYNDVEPTKDRADMMEYSFIIMNKDKYQRFILDVIKIDHLSEIRSYANFYASFYTTIGSWHYTSLDFLDIYLKEIKLSKPYYIEGIDYNPKKGYVWFFDDICKDITKKYNNFCYSVTLEYLSFSFKYDYISDNEIIRYDKYLDNIIKLKYKIYDTIQEKHYYYQIIPILKELEVMQIEDENNDIFILAKRIKNIKRIYNLFADNLCYYNLLIRLAFTTNSVIYAIIVASITVDKHFKDPTQQLDYMPPYNYFHNPDYKDYDEEAEKEKYKKKDEKDEIRSILAEFSEEEYHFARIIIYFRPELSFMFDYILDNHNIRIELYELYNGYEKPFSTPPILSLLELQEYFIDQKAKDMLKIIQLDEEKYKSGMILMEKLTNIDYDLTNDDTHRQFFEYITEMPNPNPLILHIKAHYYATCYTLKTNGKLKDFINEYKSQVLSSYMRQPLISTWLPKFDSFERIPLSIKDYVLNINLFIENGVFEKPKVLKGKTKYYR